MVTLSAGAGTCFIANSALGVGTYSVSATYSGDTNLSNSSGSGPAIDGEEEVAADRKYAERTWPSKAGPEPFKELGVQPRSRTNTV